MANEGLRDLYIDELKDLYNAENQLVKALPKMAKAASSDELKQGFQEHLEQTRGHVRDWSRFLNLLTRAQRARNVPAWKDSSRKAAKSWKKISKEL